MSHFYTRTETKESPACLAEVKSYLKNPPSADDSLIQVLIDSATEYGESYTGRAFRVQTWTLLIDAFAARITLNRNPIDAITSVSYIVSSVLTPIASSVYYLKQNVQCGEILLQDDQDWPTDMDEIEHGIEIIFTTVAYFKIDQIKDALYRHIAYLYANRGDCSIKDAGEASGADGIYDQMRIARV